MAKMRTIRRVSVSSLIAATALCAGGAFAQSLQEDASAYADSLSAAALPTVKWTAPVAYDHPRYDNNAVRPGVDFVATWVGESNKLTYAVTALP